MAFRIRRGRPIGGQAVSLALAECAGAAKAMQGAGGEPDRAVHDARRRCKRLRALLRLLRTPCGVPRVKSIERLVRDAARHLAGSRDRRICLDTFEDIAASCGMSSGEAAMAGTELASVLPKGCADVASFFENMAAVRCGLEELRDDMPRVTAGDVRAAVKKSASREREAFRAAVRDPGTDAMHAWRKRLKQLNAQAKLLEDFAFVADCRTTTGAPRRSARLARDLGRLHDLDILLLHLRRIDAKSVPVQQALDVAARRAATLRSRLAAGCLRRGG